jgi:hypothetical protein
MKRTALTIITLTVLISTVVISQNGSSAMANPVWVPNVPNEPITTPPTISISSPVFNETFISPLVTITFRIDEPEQWFEYNASIGTPPYHEVTTPYIDNMVAGNITSVYYILNGERQNLSVPVLPAFHPTNGSLPRYLSYSIPLNLTSGRYSIQIGVEANDFYLTYYAVTHGGYISTVSTHAVSDEVTFHVSLPQPSILSPKNMIYNGSSVLLQFKIGNSSVSWIGYSLDGKTNVTITGNTTLTGLTYGEHSVTVYTNDTYGNMGASETIHFNANVPEPFPTILIAVIAIIVTVIITVACLLVFFKKRKH